jgi:hypothetical protein
MSTTTLSYPNTVQLRRGSNIRWLAIFITSLALIAGVILVAALSAAGASRSSDTQPSVVVIAVPIAPITSAQALPTQTATPAPKSAVIAVPVPTPPSQ